MTVTTLAGHVARAIDFYKKTDVYFGIGGLTEWDNPNVPPTPKTTDFIKDFVGFKKVESCHLVVKVGDDATGNIIQYKGDKWRIVTLADAYIEGARWVYLNSFINYDELPVNVAYRQVGLYTGVVLENFADPNLYAYTPEFVADIGVLNILDNRPPLGRSTDLKEQLTMIVEF